jgi:hypothetical protein
MLARFRRRCIPLYIRTDLLPVAANRRLHILPFCRTSPSGWLAVLLLVVLRHVLRPAVVRLVVFRLVLLRRVADTAGDWESVPAQPRPCVIDRVLFLVCFADVMT